MCGFPGSSGGVRGAPSVTVADLPLNLCQALRPRRGGLRHYILIRSVLMSVMPRPYAMGIPGQKSAFRAGFWPDLYRKSTDMGPSAGLRPAGGPISFFSR